MIRTWMSRLLGLIKGGEAGSGASRGPRNLSVPREAVCDLALLRNRRCRLRELAHSYRDFGFHTMEAECKTSILAVDREIRDLRRNLKGPLEAGCCGRTSGGFDRSREWERTR